MSEKFTQRTHKVIRLAQKEARSFNHSHLGTEHLLLGLTGESASVAAGVLRRFGVEFDEVREQVESVIGWGLEGMGDRATFTPRAKRALEAAMQESVRQGHDYIRTDHLLLARAAETNDDRWARRMPVAHAVRARNGAPRSVVSRHGGYDGS